MKKFITLLTVFVLIFTIAISSVVSAEGEETTRTVGPGGLDFYSITIHYESPILMEYYKKTVNNVTSYYFVNPTVTEGDAYVDKNGVSLKADKLVVGGNKAGDFSVIQSSNDPSYKIYPDITAAAKPSNFAFYNHINDGNVLMQIGSTNFYGLTKPYDDGDPYVNKNPNVIYGDDGYALAVETDADGNPYRIDINGYTINSNNIWVSNDGRRCELFINVPVLRKTGEIKRGKPVTKWFDSDEYIVVDASKKFDANGKIVNTKVLDYVYYVSDADYDAFLADESKTSITPSLYEYQAKASDYATLADFNEAKQDELKTFKKKNEVFQTYAQMFKLKYADDIEDINGDKVKNYLDDPTYYTRDMTAADILTTKVDGKSVPVNGTPMLGTPQVNVKIKDITIEIDALGTQTYSDLSQDPQQQNLIHITINDCLKNIEFFDRCLEENRITQEARDIMCKSLLATVKSQTTKTTMQSATSASNTVKSISLGLDADTLANLTREKATFYLNFEIKTQQPEAAYEQYANNKNYLMKEDKFSPISIQLKTEADLPPVIATDDPNKGCCAGSNSAAIAQIMFVLGAAFVIKSKKK